MPSPDNGRYSVAPYFTFVCSGTQLQDEFTTLPILPRTLRQLSEMFVAATGSFHCLLFYSLKLIEL